MTMMATSWMHAPVIDMMISPILGFIDYLFYFFLFHFIFSNFCNCNAHTTIYIYRCKTIIHTPVGKFVGKIFIEFVHDDDGYQLDACTSN